MGNSSQFAGYYVAKEGLYDAEGLDATTKPGGFDIAPAQVLAKMMHAMVIGRLLIQKREKVSLEKY